jgi:ubiquinone/menaquinone biosynthesis C-methylase UbiE
MTNKFQSASYLKQNQYGSADKLAARIRLHEQFSTNQTDFHLWEFDLLLNRVKPETRVLEVGAGRGDLWKKNAERIPSGWQITLSDLSGGMLDDNKKHLGDELASRFEYHEFDVQSIPFEDAVFDVVIANYMLYHVSDLPQTLAEIRRVLKPGGLLFAMTNGDDHLKELVQLTRDFIGVGHERFGLMSVRGTFSTQNCGDSLRQFFDEVEFIRFDSGLYVTELQPMLDYIASSVDDPDKDMHSERAQKLTAELKRRIETEGGISITKDTGLFIARGIE